MSAPKTPSPSPCAEAEDRTNNPPAPLDFAELYGANGCRLSMHVVTLVAPLTHIGRYL